MRIMIHDTLVTAPWLHPIRTGWAQPGYPLGPLIEARADLRASALNADDVALVPSAEAAVLAETHQVVPDVAVIADGAGAIAMRTPVRPDEIAAATVRLYDVSGVAELLARATLQPFYGIKPAAWTVEDSPEAQVVIVEGAEALRDPEAGYAEDLCRAWFILTGRPVVTHVLVAPMRLDRAAIAPALDALEQLRRIAHERRRELRRELAEREAIDRERLARALAAQRLRLELADREALLALLQRGCRGSRYPRVTALTFLEPDNRQ